MKWEQELDDALRELAKSAEDVPANDATERRLLEAFDARWRKADAGAKAPRSVLLRGRGTWHLAAAASVVLILGAWWLAGRAAVGPTATEQLRPVQQAGPVTATPSTGQAKVETPAPVQAATVAAPSPVPSSAAPSRRAAARRDAPVAAAADDDASEEFVALPGASHLPSFESGMIVRVELDVTSLPAYGFPIMPDAAPRPVEADVLVGQDGQPRAIRLVSMQTGPRRRQ